MARMAWSLFLAPLLLGSACGDGQGSQVRAAAVGTADGGSGAVAPTVLLVVAVHPEGGSIPPPAVACAVSEYGAPADPSVPFYAYHSPEEALTAEIERPGPDGRPGSLPRSGWHRVNRADGSVLFVYVSHGVIRADVDLGSDRGTYGAREWC